MPQEKCLDFLIKVFFDPIGQLAFNQFLQVPDGRSSFGESTG